jgi:hypothetical protein
MLNLFPSSGGESTPSGRKHTAARRAPSQRPEVEPLEDRLVPTKIAVHATADGPVTPLTPIDSQHKLAANLRSAVVLSQAGDEIDLDNGKTYQVTGAEGGELLVTHNLLIKNNGGGRSTVEAFTNVSDQFRVFEISGAEGGTTAVTMAGLTITGGSLDSDEGGGVLVDEGAKLTMNNCIVTGNHVTGEGAFGGGVSNHGVVALNQCVISMNTAQGGDEDIALGAGFYQGSNGGALTITKTTFSKNTAQGGANGGSALGGGLYVGGNSGLLTVTASAFTGNTAQGGTNGGEAQGGGMFEVSDSKATISTTTFNGNVAQGGLGGGEALGGGVYFNSELSTLSVVDSTFSGNRAVGGSTNPQEVSGSGGSDGGDGQGGGLYEGSEGGSLTISRSTFFNNQAVGGLGLSGGGDSGGGDGGAGQGGGLYQFFGDLSVFNSTFAGNSAGNFGQGVGVAQLGASGPGDGGGLFLFGGGSVLLVNDTVAGNNRATSTGGGIHSDAGDESPPPQVWNTLIAMNSAPSGPDVFGSFTSLGHNLIGKTAGSSGFSAAKHDLLNVAASKIGLGPLANNGGPTLTMALSATSVAVNAGDDAVLTNPKTKFTTDQRGLPRKSGAHVDIGAFEFQQPPPPPSGGHSRRNGPPLP